MHDVATNISELNEQMQRVDSTWSERDILCDWSHLAASMMARTERKIFFGRTIPGSTGELVMDTEKIKYFSNDGVNILTSNECQEEMNTNPLEFCQKGRSSILDFIRGTEPDWPVFYFTETSEIPLPIEANIPPGLVKRKFVDQVIADVNCAEKNETKPITRISIIHQPGSGATTLGRHVLWHLRREKKCCMIDGRNYRKNNVTDSEKLSRVADLILNFRGYRENDEVVQGEHVDLSCPTVVVLFDNCVPLLAKQLTTLLQTKCEKRRMKFRKTMIVIICVYSTFESDIPCNSDPEYGTKLTDKKHILEQELSTGEKKLFQARLQILNKEVDIKDMLSFVIFAEDFNMNSTYVKRVVQETLLDMGSLYPDQQTLLLYLALLKHFGNLQLPKKHCELLSFKSASLFSKIEKKSIGDIIHHYKTFSPQVVAFTRETKEFIQSGLGSFLEISHAPVAYHLFQELSKSTSLSGIVKNMMGEKALVEERFFQDLVHSTFVELLTKRAFITDRRGIRRKMRFSKLITKIIDDENKEMANEVLQDVYEVFREGKDKHRSVIAQSLARLHCEGNWNSLKVALKWAEKASLDAPERFTAADTKGQVYKRMLV